MFTDSPRDPYEIAVLHAVVEMVARRGKRLDDDGGPGIYSSEYLVGGGAHDGALVFFLYSAPETRAVAREHIAALVDAIGRARPWAEHLVMESIHER